MRISLKNPDNCVQIGKEVCLIKNILYKEKKGVKLIYESFLHDPSYFLYPLSSLKLGIHKVSLLSNYLKVCSLEEITCKYLRLPYKEKFVEIPLITFSF